MSAIGRGLLLATAAASVGYSIFALARMRAFARDRRRADPHGTPGISVLKPLHGDEPQLYENLRSLCVQQYPQFQIIFCAAAHDDPALAHARRLQREFPQIAIAIAAGNPRPAANPKIANLLGGIDRARYEIIAIADSDVRVEPGHLRALASCFADAHAGAATCLYFGEAEGAMAAELGAMFVNEQFAPSVLVAAALWPLTYCLGATMAVRRDVLEKFGGLSALGAHLGDDYMLGKNVSGLGYRVELCAQPVTTLVHERSLRALWMRELRWARTIRRLRPGGFAGSLLTHTLFWCGLALLAAPGLPSALLAAAGLAARLLLHSRTRKMYLVPVRDALSLGVWCGAWSGHRIGWRGTGYEVDAKGRLLDGPGCV